MNTIVMKKLLDRCGTYCGRGINHEGLPFNGTLKMKSLLGEKGVGIEFEASGDDGTTFHQECTTIAPMITGGMKLFNLNSNSPGLVVHDFSSESIAVDGVESVVFAFGRRNDKQSFREEISIGLHPNGDLSYNYAWGMPGGEFAERSSATLKRN